MGKIFVLGLILIVIAVIGSIAIKGAIAYIDNKSGNNANDQKEEKVEDE